MKIDFDLIREIFLKIETNENQVNAKCFLSENCSIEKINMHVEILLDKKYIKAQKSQTICMDYPEYGLQSLTLDGYEYFSQMKNKTVWEKIKTIAAMKGLPLSFKIIEKISEVLINKMILKE
jgi:hypothetical protein